MPIPRGPVLAQQRQEWTSYADALTAAITDRLHDLSLSVPIHVEITPDYDSATQIGETPTHDGIYERHPITDAVVRSCSPLRQQVCLAPRWVGCLGRRPVEVTHRPGLLGNTRGRRRLASSPSPTLSPTDPHDRSQADSVDQRDGRRLVTS